MNRPAQHDAFHPLVWFALAALVLAAVALRLYRLDAVPLRGDEAYSVMHWTATPFSDKWVDLLRMEPAPVGAFTMYWAWNGLVGTSELATRYLSLLGNVAGLAATFVLGRRLLGDVRLAFMVGVLWALHPFLIWHAQDARVYGVLSALTPLTFYWLLRAVDAVRAGQGDRLKPWLPYIAVQTAAVYIYYFEPFWMIAQGLFVVALALIWRSRAILRAAIRAWVVVVALIIPVIAQVYVLMFVSGYEGTAVSAQPLDLFAHFIPAFFFGQHAPHLPVPLGILIAAGILAGLLWRARADARLLMLPLWLFIPPLILTAVSFVADFFLPRYVMTVVPALLIGLVAVAAHIGRNLPSPRAAVLMPAALVVVMGGFSAGAVYHYHHIAPPKAGDWPGLVAYLSARTTENDVIISDSVDPALEYYYDGPARVFFIPFNRPPAEDYLPALLENYHAFFLLAGQNTDLAAAYLSQFAQPIPGDTFPGVNQFRRWRVSPDEIAYPLNITFGDVAILRGFTPLGRSTLILYWEAAGTTEAEHSILLHLERTPDAPPESVLDHPIAGGRISTRTWTPGTLYRDPVALPVELPPGDYTIKTGLYASESGAPVLTTDLDSDDARYAVGALHIDP